MNNILDNNTICAIATAQGGAIGVVRVSGPESVDIVSKIFFPKHGKPFMEREASHVIFGEIRDGENVVDEVLVTIFRSPHSYTGEDSVEISCHGSSYILQTVLRLLTDNGCVLAGPGEFTKRAFLNGKMDLSQAEAVADLIASSSEATHRMAMNQMRGGFSHELAALRDKLLHITSLMELELDFSDHEELEFADRTELQSIADNIEDRIARLCKSFSLGNAIKNGIPVAIIGETNAGKSTLLNVLLNEDKAIVSSIHGTTRDVIEDTVNIDGILFRFIDTAGIRDTDDEIESIGIERTYQKIEQASIVLWMLDASTALMQWGLLADKVLPKCEGKELVVVFNKMDMLPEGHDKLLENALCGSTFDHIFISAKNRVNIDTLQRKLVELSGVHKFSAEDVVVSNMRHFEALSHALESIRRVKEGLAMHLSGDLVSQDLRECIYYLSDIVGEVTTDEVLGNIFKNFCIGK